MGIRLGKYFACCCKTGENSSSGGVSSSSSPQHLLSASPSASNAHINIPRHASCKVDPNPVIYYRASLISLRPLALLIPNFLKPHECQALISLATPFLKPSRVCGEFLTADRTSSSMFFTGPLQHHPTAVALQYRLHTLVSSIASTLGRSDLQLTEALQVVKYSQGQSYALHRDNDTENPNHTLKRAATAIIYLNTTSPQGGGGHTVFPSALALLPKTKTLLSNGVKYLKRSSSFPDFSNGGSSSGGDVGGGFSVQPRQGHVLLFWSALPNGKEDMAALHEAAPVVIAGEEKFIATHWFSEK